MTAFSMILETSGMSMMEISNKRKIPYRTMQHWKAGTRTPSEYVLYLLKAAINQGGSNRGAHRIRRKQLKEMVTNGVDLDKYAMKQHERAFHEI